jgi:hypothetical protein
VPRLYVNGVAVADGKHGVVSRPDELTIGFLIKAGAPTTLGEFWPEVICKIVDDNDTPPSQELTPPHKRRNGFLNIPEKREGVAQTQDKVIAVSHLRIAQVAFYHGCIRRTLMTPAKGFGIVVKSNIGLCDRREYSRHSAITATQIQHIMTTTRSNQPLTLQCAPLCIMGHCRITAINSAHSRFSSADRIVARSVRVSCSHFASTPCPPYRMA